MDRERIERLVELNSNDHDAKNARDKLDIRHGGSLPKFKIRDLVRITKDPPNQNYYAMRGRTGFITEDQGVTSEYGRMYYFQELNPEYGDGTGGAGSVPGSCLEHFSPDWLKGLKKKYGDKMKARMAHFQKSQKPGVEVADPYADFYDD